tara:strand:- start:977 stop:1501 length:525 start_codon:yes stop_codon:yes gene_type:complete
MRKIIFFIISFLFILSSIASACNFRISNFGDPKENIKIEPIAPILMPDRFGGESLIIPIEDLCKTNDSLYGTTVIYLYLENKLSRIQLYRPNMEDSKLMDYAMNKFGKFKLPEGLPKRRWRGSYVWESGNESIEYIRTNIHDGHAEIIDITSNINSYAINEYNSKVGEWLDSQQ